MRTLVIDTATPHLSVALFEHGQLIGHRHELIGRGHAELLVPSIAALPDGGWANKVCVGCGPGSFTGQRIGLSAARALAFVWNAELWGFNSLALVAADGRKRSGARSVAVAVDGGHGEWLTADDVDGERVIEAGTMPPESACLAVASPIVAGQRGAELVRLRGWGESTEAEADTRLFPLLGPQQCFAHPRPLYARPPDAKAAA